MIPKAHRKGAKKGKERKKERKLPNKVLKANAAIRRKTGHMYNTVKEAQIDPRQLQLL